MNPARSAAILKRAKLKKLINFNIYTSMKPTTLIAKTTRAAMLEARDQKIADLEKKNQLEKWSDNAVESKVELFVFKVIPLNLSNLLAPLHGYNYVKVDDLIAELKEALQTVESLAYPEPTPTNAAPAPQNEPSGAEKVDNGEKKDENKEKDDSKDEVKLDNIPF